MNSIKSKAHIVPGLNRFIVLFCFMLGLLLNSEQTIAAEFCLDLLSKITAPNYLTAPSLAERLSKIGLGIGTRIRLENNEHITLFAIDSHSISFRGVDIHGDKIREFIRKLHILGGFDDLLYVYDFDSYGVEMKNAYIIKDDARYATTNREIRFLRSASYLQSEMDKEQLLKTGGLVADLGAGNLGDAVRKLRAEGINAIGVDISAEVTEDNKHYLRREDIRHTSFATGSVRRAFSSFSIFYYGDRPTYILAALNEIQRILEPGGLLHIAGGSDVDQLKSLVSKTTHLEWVDSYPGRALGETITIRRR